MNPEDIARLMNEDWEELGIEDPGFKDQKKAITHIAYCDKRNLQQALKIIKQIIARTGGTIVGVTNLTQDDVDRIIDHHVSPHPARIPEMVDTGEDSEDQEETWLSPEWQGEDDNEEEDLQDWVPYKEWHHEAIRAHNRDMEKISNPQNIAKVEYITYIPRTSSVYRAALDESDELFDDYARLVNWGTFYETD